MDKKRKLVEEKLDTIKKIQKVSLPVAEINVCSLRYITKKTSNEMFITSENFPNLDIYVPYRKEKQCLICSLIYDTLQTWYKHAESDAIREIKLIDLEGFVDDLSNQKEDHIPPNLDEKKKRELHGKQDQQEDQDKPKINKKDVNRQDYKYDLDQDELIEEVDHHKHYVIINEVYSVKIANKSLINVKKQLSQIFYVQKSDKTILSYGTYNNKFEPWGWQENASSYIKKQYNWQEAIDHSEHYLPFLFYVLVGAGKTSGILYALDQNPTKEIVIVCDLSTLHSGWKRELMTLVPHTNNMKIKFHLIGYNQLTNLVHNQVHFFKNKIIIVDESQEYRGLTLGSQSELEAFRECIILFQLTGTPFLNGITDLFGLNVLSEVSPVATMKEMIEKAQLVREGTLEEYYPDDNPFWYMTGNIENTTLTLEEQEVLSDPNNTKSKNNMKKKSSLTQKDCTAFYHWLYEQYKHRVCYYTPDIPVANEKHDVLIEMSWLQTCEYIWSSRKDLTFGNLTTTSGIRNSFDSMLRRVSNCLLDKEEKRVTDSNKFAYIIQWIESKLDLPLEQRQQYFPLILFSRFRKRGTDAIESLLKDKNISSKLTCSVLSGDTSDVDREKICHEYNNGKVDILSICKIGKRGLNLKNTKVMMLVEIPDSIGEQNQNIGRCIRSGSKDQRNKAPIQIYRLISTFPNKTPTSKEKIIIDQFFIDKLQMSMKEIHQYMNDCSEEVLHHLVRLKNMTVDQKCALRNPQKQKMLNNVETVLQYASITYQNIPKMFEQDFLKL